MANKYDKAYVVASNVFLFGEESDFLSVSRERLSHEFEIKISRSDFKADFKKAKHLEMKAILEGKEFATIPGKQTDTCSIESLLSNYENYLNNYSNHWAEFKRPWTEYRPKFREIPYSCRVTFNKIILRNLPNKFSFVVPEGLISPDEVPNYAGLFYVNKFGGIREVKRGKFLHKEKFSRWEDLCLKFFYRLKYKFQVNGNNQLDSVNEFDL